MRYFVTTMMIIICFLQVTSAQAQKQHIALWLSTGQIVIADQENLTFYTPQLLFISHTNIISNLLYPDSGGIFRMKASANGRYLALMLSDPRFPYSSDAVYIFDTLTNQIIYQLIEGDTGDVSWSPDSQYLAVSQSFEFNVPTSTPEITVIDAISKSVINRFKLPPTEGVASKIEWSASNKLLTNGKRLSLWDISEPTSINYVTSIGPVRTPDVISSPDGNLFLVDIYNMTTQVRELSVLRASNLSQETKFPLEEFSLATFWQNEGLFMAIRGSILLKLSATGEEIWRRQLPDLRGLAFNGDSSQILVIEPSGIASIQNTLTGEVLFSADLNSIPVSYERQSP